MTKILMVCLGNICRSPLAEGILKSKVDTSKVRVDSAGTGGYHIGNPPDSRSIAVAQKHGINIKGQTCRKFTARDFETFDMIYVMDKSNHANVTALAKTIEEKNKVKLLLEEANLAIAEVPDPYYGGTSGFDYVYDLIDKACDRIADTLNNGGK